MPGPSPLSPPRQDRSRRTLERLLEETERLLEDHPFESITVRQIVTGARTSVGSFYNLFRDKQSMLPALYARYDTWLEDHLRAIEAAADWENRSLREVLRMLISYQVQVFRGRRHLMRTLALYARSRSAEIDPAIPARRRQQHGFVFRALLARRHEIHHPDPERAVELAVFFTAAVCRDRILFAEAPHATLTGGDDDELIEELERMTLGYLGAAGPDAGGSGAGSLPFQPL